MNYLGYKIRPNTSDQKAIDEVVTKKDYERKYFKPSKDDVWADLGANIGAFSRLYADDVKKIYAYEPSPISYSLLVENTKDKPNVECIQKAVSNKDGTIQFYERPKQNWRNSTRNIFKDSVLTFVGCIGADKLPEDVNAVKIDVEGSELEIMEALDMSKINKLIMEWSFDFLPEIKHYRVAVEVMKQNFDNVIYGEVKGEVWQKNWFPPCKKIIAYNN
jgi:FkbM family methyltransferase